ncbi:carboxyltransferase domain-containing protein [Sinomonas sp. ASV486]|uniref:5-oxoprolinase subunit B/C family protein n=1 Tax=Sinomonas sp. ASV486 TaxID=3051170 RepID=UPI0027DD7C24|nr:carboxyltransferase domain-containing protein [Sinomonas sp. ASV486]MDQ4491633.1 carboxyltransferase domain-containing protein [Sinomonas sp. ASV486]
MTALGGAPGHPGTESRADPIISLRAAGDRAVLVELRTLGGVLALTSHLAAAEHAGDVDVVDVVAAATTVLIVAESASAVARAAAYVRSLHLEDAAHTPGRLVRITTVYDGADLDELAQLAGLSPEALVASHSGTVWDAAFGGFAPGFTYLTHDAAPSVPRRTSPRTVVPAGSVALAGAYSAVYPGESPGGWQLIGHTDAVMWDLSREDPALVQPGDRVQFVPVRESTSLAATAADGGLGQGAGPSQPAGPSTSDERGPAEGSRPAEAGLVVVRPGMQTTIQDLGRPGRASLGVSPAGALDRGALRQANRIAGNAPGDAALEVLLGGLELRAASDQVLAVTGARVPLRITAAPAAVVEPGAPAGADGPETPQARAKDPSTVREAPLDTPFALLAGETLTLGIATEGLRAYVAVRGGIDAPLVLGSASTDSLSGIGPAPLAEGQTLRIRPMLGAHVVGLPEVPRPLPGGAVGGATVLRVLPGPREDWFTDASARAFFGQEWTVTPQSNRVGLRLDGAPLERAREGELTSEGTARGSVQVPANGLPVLFLADAPVTGGYPVIGVVASADLDLAAQLPPGATVRFVPLTSSEGTSHA